MPAQHRQISTLRLCWHFPFGLLLFFPIVFGIAYLMFIFLVIFWPKGHN